MQERPRKRSRAITLARCSDDADQAVRIGAFFPLLLLGVMLLALPWAIPQ